MTEPVPIKKKHGHVCPHKFGFMLDNWIRRWIQSPVNIVREFINKGDTVIDMGCGPGFFSVEMAKLVGDEGCVIAVDLQEHMLQKVKKKATRHGVLKRMEFHQCKANTIGLNRKADFILAFYMIHETPDAYRFFCEMKPLLKKDSRLLVVEPRIHVKQKAFNTMCTEAERAGLKALDFPKGKGGRSVLLGIQTH